MPDTAAIRIIRNIAADISSNLRTTGKITSTTPAGDVCALLSAKQTTYDLFSNRESLVQAEEELVRAAAAGATIIGLDDANYPPLLRQIYDPPVALYARGDASILTAARILLNS